MFRKLVFCEGLNLTATVAVPTASNYNSITATIARRWATNIPMSTYLQAANSRYTGGGGDSGKSNALQFRDKFGGTMAEVKEIKQRMRAEDEAKRMREKLSRAIDIASKSAEAKKVERHRHQLNLALRGLRQQRDILNNLGEFDNSAESRVHQKIRTIMRGLDVLTLKSASTDELIELVQAASYFDDHSSQALSYSIQLLASRKAEMKKVSDILILLEVLSGVPALGGALSSNMSKQYENWGSPRDNELPMQAAFRTHFFLEFMSHILVTPGLVSSLRPKNYDFLLRILQLDKKQLTPANLGYEITKGFIQKFHSDIDFQNRSTINHVARVASCITQFKVTDREAAMFFVDTEQLVRDFADGLRPNQLSHLLVAYATVGYPNTELFMFLGQKAGDMGEQLSDDDAARVLTALDSQTQLDTTKLRASLESSMRLKEMVRTPFRSQGFGRETRMAMSTRRPGGYKKKVPFRRSKH